MTGFALQNPYPLILALNGIGLNSGKVYVGLPNQDPVTNPKAVYWDAALTIPATQPLSVSGGYFRYLGSPAVPYVAGAASITVQDAQGVQVFTSAGVRFTGSGVPTQQKFTSSSGTYTTPAGCTWIRVRMVGGGGGGGAGGQFGSAGGSGSAGGNTTFGSSLLTANGGAGGAGGGVVVANAGGTASLGSATGIALQGGSGQSAGGASTNYTAGGAGAPTPFGGAGAGVTNGVGVAAITNTGSGGGGGGTNNSAGNNNAGQGGAAGGYVDALITSPAATYSYAVGASGLGNGSPAIGIGYGGAAGGSGIIIVEEHYD